MTRAIGLALGAAAVALAGLATTWRTQTPAAGVTAASGFAEVPRVALVLLGLGVLLVLVAWRTPVLLRAAAVCFAAAAVVAVVGVDNGPAFWLFVGGNVAAAIFSAFGPRLRPPTVPPPITGDSAEDRVRRALSTDG